MHLPSLATGKRFTLPRPPGSADALLLAQLAEREKAAGRITAIVTSEVQNGVVGAQSALPVLADEAQRAMVPNLAKLLPVARAAGVHRGVGHALDPVATEPQAGIPDAQWRYRS